MSGARALLAGFPESEALVAAARAARDAGRPALDAFTPFPVEGLAEAVGASKPPLPWIMLAAGLGVAAAAYLMEWWSAKYGYTLNLGGRPLHSWPAFLIAPAEIGVLAAALAGFVGFLAYTGLPRLNHPLFERDAFDRASQDQFLLALPWPAPEEAGEVREKLFAAGALWVQEAEL